MAKRRQGQSKTSAGQRHKQDPQRGRDQGATRR